MVLLQTGARIQLDITGLTHDGAGVGRHEGLAVFVPGALPGENVEGRIIEARPRFARATLLSVLSPSPDRLRPDCAVGETCGGCGLAHLSYQAQLAYKTQRVKDALKRIGRFAIAGAGEGVSPAESGAALGHDAVLVADCLPSPAPEGYRNKVQFAVVLESGRVRLGLLGASSHQVYPAEHCAAAHPAIRSAAEAVAGVLTEALLTAPQTAPASPPAPVPRPAPSDAPSLDVRHVVIRYAQATGELMIILATPTRRLPGWPSITDELLRRVPGLVSVVQLVNGRPGGAVLAGERFRVAGRDHIEDSLLGLRFLISPESFYQINLAQTERLYTKALEMAALTGRESVVDVYCGIGTITLLAAARAREAVGIESIPAAVQDAAANAELNNLHNARFLAGPAEQLLPRLSREGLRPDVIIVDPPRAGVEKPALTAIATMRPARIVYVSCDPESLARDLAVLAQSGYRVNAVQPVDMFPQTSHTEVVAVATRQ